MFADLRQDLRYGFRMMRKNPGFTLVAVFALALGIGANTAIFSLINAILLRPLPYPESDHLVRLMQTYPEKGLDTWRLSQANFAAYREQSRSFDSVAAYTVTGLNLTGFDQPERLQAARVTGDFFKVLGMDPLLGRTFLPEEDAPGKNNVCVLSYGFWQRRFGGNRDVIGKALALNNVSTEVVGVMPADFKFPLPDTEIWTPLGLNAQARFPWFLTGIGRLKSGVQPAGAQAETTGILWNLGQQDPQMVSRSDPPPPGANLKTVIVPLKEAIIGDTKKPLLLLQFAVACVLLIACANVANLLLSRAASRTREIALRFALGATPRRVVRQLLTESVLLALIGAATGIALAWWVMGALGRLPIEGIPRTDEVGLSGTVLAFTVVVAVVTGLLFGLVPALRTYRLGLKAGLSEGQRGSSGGASRHMNRILVAAQLAVSVVLLISAGLMLKGYRQLLAVNPGFQAENVLTMQLPLAGQKYSSDQGQMPRFYQSLLEQVRTIPGVRAAGVTTTLPLGTEESSDGYLVEGQEPSGGGDSPQAQLKVVSPGYFQAMGMLLLRGRDFQENDNTDAPLAVIIDETLARRHWPDGNAIGHRVRTTGDPPWLTVVGVVSSIKDKSLAGEVRPHIYFAYGQAPRPRMYLVVRTVGDPTTATESIRSKVRQIDPTVPVYAVRTMTDVVEKTLNSQRLTNLLLTAFAAIALLLAAVGIYGVMSVYVTSRTQEFGIRLALGARPSYLLRSVLWEGLLLALGGIAVGILFALAMTRTITSLLFEVSATDPFVFTALPLLLIAVALVSCYMPARRAARTDPLTALRYE